MAVPDKPVGSEIDEEVREGSLTLSWRKPSRWTRYLIAVFYLSGFGFTVFFVVGGLIAPVPGRGPPAEVWGCSLLFLSLFGIIFGRILWLLLRARKESLTLEAAVFRYDLGTSPIAEYYVGGQRNKNISLPRGFGFYRELFRRRRPIEVARSTMTEFRLDRIGERQRLYFDFGADRIEIGAELREPDREWLFAVLTNYAGTS